MFSQFSRIKYTLGFGSAAVTLALCNAAFAQVPGAATSTADPGRAQERFSDSMRVPDLSSKVEVRDLVLQEMPDGAENINFDLQSISLEGVSVYSENQLSPLYADKIGTNVTLADIYGISTALTNKYRNDGYILTQVIVPPQTIEGGHVQLQVVEGYVDTITVEGTNQENGLDLVRRYASGIDTSKALNVKDLERHLLIISDLPGMDARGILSPSSTKTGAADLRVVVTRDPYDALLSFDNYGSRYLGPYQFSASGSANSFFGNNERITAQIVAAPDPGTDAPADLELGYYAVSYEHPLPFLGTGTKVEFLASYTDTEPGYDLRQFEVEGISRYWSAKVSHPFIRSRSQNLYGHILFDWRNVDSRSNVLTTIKDRIRAARIGADYEFLDTFLGVGVNSLSVELAKGLDVMSASDKGDANMTRGRADPQFTKLNADIQRLQRVTSNVNLLVSARGQVSSAPLLSSEEFGVGGVDIGRAYDSSEIVGDEGIAGKVEVQWNQPYEINGLDDYQLFGFYDAGRIWNDDATTSSQKTDTVTSTGFGVRTTFFGDVHGDAFVAVPLNRDVQTQGDRDPRFYFSISRPF